VFRYRSYLVIKFNKLKVSSKKSATVKLILRASKKGTYKFTPVVYKKSKGTTVTYNNKINKIKVKI
jgi:hypothetical protein